MSIKYNYNEIIDMIGAKIDEDAGSFYRNKAVNYRGEVRHSDEKYSEVVAKHIYDLEKQGKGLKIDKVDHSKEKETIGILHKREHISFNNTNRNEENIAKSMVKQRSKFISKTGKEMEAVDYQVPVNRVYHSGDGKIDLIAKGDHRVTICELKDNKSEETLLRALLEIETYFRKVSEEKLKKCYDAEIVEKAVIIFANTRPYNDLKDEFVMKLRDKWDIAIYEAKIDQVGDWPQDARYTLYQIY
ncbi:MAG: hypothetical protein Q4C25_03395 [Bacillota bacterium]|nr:hypothetical protein [Bacillota bacterium]